MNFVRVLDCTLRDGGYCNKWDFGKQNIHKIIYGLSETNIEIIECGFLTNRVEYDINRTKYTDLRQLEAFIPHHSNVSMFVVMINYGEYDVEQLPDADKTPIDGIRIAFHKKDWEEALILGEKIKRKGYNVFLQPMVTMLYSDSEFRSLIARAKDLNPYAFYIVDSFGTMNKNELNHYWSILDNELDSDIFIGFHSHNNLQLAYANAQWLLDRESIHSFIVDSTIYGMGRGAGNLNSELFLNELNIRFGKGYEIKPILKIMDEVINWFYKENPWGYSLPNYLSAIHMLHPNYARYLSEKNTLAVEDIDNIFSMIDSDTGIEYNEEFVKKIYIKYMSDGIARKEHLSEIKEKVKDRSVLLIAPGRKALEERALVDEFIKRENPIIISINHESLCFQTDYIFISNKRRFKELDERLYYKIISTSNIKSLETFVSIDYFSLLNEVDSVRDNAGLMTIKFVIDELGIRQINLAGFDGYSHDLQTNFVTSEMTLYASDDFFDRTNKSLKIAISIFRKISDITFITSSLLE